MKPLKYALVFILLCCFLTSAEAAAAEIYTLDAIFIGVNEGVGSGPELTVKLLEDGREVDIEVAENCLFIETTWLDGEQTAEITFAEFQHGIGFAYLPSTIK